MSAFARVRIALLLVPLAAAPVARAATPDIEVFSRHGCPRCGEAAAFLEVLRQERPDVDVAVYDVGADRAARERLARLAREHGVPTLGVPSFLVGDRLIVGFSSSGQTGEEIRAALARRETSVLRLPFWGELDAAVIGLPLFTIAIGLVDGFNPCATWVLLFLLSLLVNLHDRRRMLAVAGSFVVVSGAAYFAFMLAWLNAFLLLGASRPVEIVLALFAVGVGGVNLKDAARPGTGPSVGIPEAAKPGIYARTRRILQAPSMRAALAGASVLAVLVNVVELVCTAGLPALYTRILTLQGVGRWASVGYLLLYVAAYMADDTLMVVAAVVTLSRMKLQARGARVLKGVSGGVMLGLGLLLLFAPERLAGS